MLRGATTGIRTQDLILTMDALYQLSYRGKVTLDILADNNNQENFLLLLIYWVQKGS